MIRVLFINSHITTITINNEKQLIKNLINSNQICFFTKAIDWFFFLQASNTRRPKFLSKKMFDLTFYKAGLISLKDHKNWSPNFRCDTYVDGVNFINLNSSKLLFFKLIKLICLRRILGWDLTFLGWDVFISIKYSSHSFKMHFKSSNFEFESSSYGCFSKCYMSKISEQIYYEKLWI